MPDPEIITNIVTVKLDELGRPTGLEVAPEGAILDPSIVGEGPLKIESGQVVLSEQAEGLNFNLDGINELLTLGNTKILFEFQDKSRISLGRNSVPLEMSSSGEANIHLESDGTNGAYVLLKGSDVTSPNTRLHLENANLSADANSEINFDTDILMSDSAYVRGDMIGSNFLECKNAQGATLTAGTPVHIVNFFGNTKVEVIEASATIPNSMPAVGILAQDLVTNQQGLVDIFGVTDGVNTQAFDEGEVLYVASTGGLTNVRPRGSTDLVQNIGIVSKASNNGRVVVLGSGRTNDVPNSLTKLFSAKYSGAGNFPISLTTLPWDSPDLNTAGLTYVAGQFIVPNSLVGSYMEFSIQVGLQCGLVPSRTMVTIELQKDTGSGYTTLISAKNYIIRNNSIDEGTHSISGFIDPDALSAGDKYRVQVSHYAEGNPCQYWPTGTRLSLKAHQP